MSTIDNKITLDNSPYEISPLTTEQISALTTSTIDTIDISGLGITSSTSPSYTIGSIGSSNTLWTTTTTGTGYNWSGLSAIGGVDTTTHISQSGKVSLRGEGADVDINGKSLKDWMEKVEERLNILTPNPELEKEWDDLRKLGERYRRLEKKCKEKAEVWKKLKAMPPPKVD